MKTLVCTKPFQFDYVNSEKPMAKMGETLLKIERIGICGTDLHAFEGTQPFFSYPRILGHELAATIVETNAKGFLPNDAVTIIPYFSCGKCIACRMNNENCCSSINVFGVHIDGGMREFVVVPDEYLVKSEGLDYDELALVEPLSISAHGVRRAAIKKDEFVLVVGAGPIGIGTMEFARIAGGKVIAMDVNEERLNFCKENVQIEYAINPLKEDAMEKLKQITNHDMPTVIIDASGNQKAINNAFQYLGHGGRFVLIGLQKGEIQFMHPEFHKRESTLMSSRNATKEDFEFAISCIKNGMIKPTNYITQMVSFDDVKSDFTKWLNPEEGVIKAMIYF